MMVSAQRLTATRDCAAWNCTLDAEPGMTLCWRCALKPAVRLHEPPELDTRPSLRCASHARFYPGENPFLPDESFNHHVGKAERRGRHPECRRCCSTRKRIERANWTPEQRQRERERARR